MNYKLKISETEWWISNNIERYSMSLLIYWNRDNPQEFRKFFINETEKIKETMFIAIDDYYRLFSYYGLDLLELLPQRELNDFIHMMERCYPDGRGNIWDLIYSAIENEHE